ncbi:DUF3141 domain-containing protein [Belnapia rosea]|uniref:Poly(3-hydroxyalkanoate) synthetase n=1 Tax=Belnapia rosea TaxID=938405 RepID=A0A1G6W6L0_9PROT|nr:DUF3141 domain-containing protein [Belnapia rosea]SDD61464.1 Protein of unknown function [Belnapia rosea]
MLDPLPGAGGLPRAPWQAATDYLLDCWQRQILFLDVLRQRGNQYRAHLAETAPSVLGFTAEPVMDGRDLPRPVNYTLSRILPPAGMPADRRRRPFVIVDPRAGHGPGIGGFKPDSEVGVALRGGHPCYFIGFLPRPEPGQTVEDVMQAEASFVGHVAGLHPEAEGLPVVIGNCQAGWQVAMGAATRPELFGPILLAGTPLSYWAGWRGMNPMRYAGGMLGGTWLTAWAGDIGHGFFDGAWLVQNFESLNPANTLWTKAFTVYSKVDTEAPRYLGFEKYWGGYVLLNAGEMQQITDDLFVGNRLSNAEMTTRDGRRIDLRNIRGPIIVFCSRGDNITPPPQALGWILDLYGSVDDIRAREQTIVYALHDSIGHLGIFVSGQVARKEHLEFASNIDFIDLLPPGLYEAEILAEDEPGPDGLPYRMRFLARGMDDLRAIVQPRPEDDRRFAAVARLSEVNLGLYRQFAQPWIRAAVTPEAAEWGRRMHPLRLRYESFSDANPAMAAVAPLAAAVRENRRPVPPGNPFLAIETAVSGAMERGLDAWRDARDLLTEGVFLTVYGNPLLQSLLGLGAREAPPRQRPGRDPEQIALVGRRVAEIRASVAEGGLREAMLRGLMYVSLQERVADQRSFDMLRRVHASHGLDLSLAEFKAMLRRELLLLTLDEEAALAALPRMLRGATPAAVEEGLAALTAIALAAGPLSPAGQERLERIGRLIRSAVRAAPPRRRARQGAPS